MDERKFETQQVLRVNGPLMLPLWKVLGDDNVLTTRGEILGQGELLVLVEKIEDTNVWRVLTRFGTRFVLRVTLKKTTAEV